MSEYRLIVTSEVFEALDDYFDYIAIEKQSPLNKAISAQCGTVVSWSLASPANSQDLSTSLSLRTGK